MRRMAERTGPEDVAAVLTRLLRTMELETELLAHAVEPIWPRVAGPRLAPNARAASLRQGVLVIEARSAAWMNELSMQREQLRAGFNRELRRELVRELRFRLGGGFPPLPAPPPVRSAEEESRLRSRAEGLLASEADSEGGAIVAAALTARLRRPGGGR